MIGETVKLGFNATAVHRGFAKVGAGFQALAGKMKMAGRAMLAPFTKLMAVLAPLLTVGAFARGIKDIVDYGGAVSDLAARLGIAADQVVYLQEVFRRTGLDQDRMADTLQIMGRNVYEALAYGTATYTRALADLSLEGKDLAGLNLAGQFELIASRIAALTNENQRASVSSTLFGRQGRALVNTFKSWNEVSETSRQSVGRLGDNMNDLAGRLDYVSDAMGAVVGKFRQFFAGLVKPMLPYLNEMADAMNALDLSGAGERLGQLGAKIADIFKSGQIGSAIWESLKWAGQRFIELLATAAIFFAEQLNEAISKTDLGKKMGIKSVTEQTSVPVFSGNPRSTPIRRITSKGRSVPTFGEINKEWEGKLSGGSAANIRQIAAAAALAARINMERGAATPTDEKYLKPMVERLREISRNTTPELKPATTF